MKTVSWLGRDPQDAPPVLICDKCGGEVYSERAYAVIARRCICLACEARLLERLLRDLEGRKTP